MSIEKLVISGYKSIEKIELTNISSFSSFAGANGAGKSNLFDAICFASTVIKIGAIDAIRQFGSYGQIHCFKKRGTGARTFKFSIKVKLEESFWVYTLEIKHMDSIPFLVEELYKDRELILSRKEGHVPKLGSAELAIPDYPQDRSALIFTSKTPIFHWLSNINVYRIDPIGAKEPDSANTDNSDLNKKGDNVASVLAARENDTTFREFIMEWMEMIVPGLERVSTEHLKLQAQTALKFSEEGTKTLFPANLISDGTIYTLCILTAILTRHNKIGLTLIEEPERGINPKALAQIVELMREYSSTEHPIWVSTHNETLVRTCSAEELLVVDKEDGRTQFRYGRDVADSLKGMDLDKAWLSNLIGGGLPW